jgi:ribosomal protein S18 acetylase RimI-like enzyme
MSIEEVRASGRIESGYETTYVLRLERRQDGSGITWRLREVALAAPYRKLYDRGSVDEWLESYTHDPSSPGFQFIGAFRGRRLLGIITWDQVQWNNTISLTDIRVRREEQRRGIGTELMRCLKAEALRRTVRGIAVETQINNMPAVRFYTRHGFRIAGFNDHLYSNQDLADQDVAVFLFWEAG